MLVLVPTVIVTATVMIILFFDSFSVGEKIPEALARGFLKSRYILTRGTREGRYRFLLRYRFRGDRPLSIETLSRLVHKNP